MRISLRTQIVDHKYTSFFGTSQIIALFSIGSPGAFPAHISWWTSLFKETFRFRRNKSKKCLKFHRVNTSILSIPLTTLINPNVSRCWRYFRLVFSFKPIFQTIVLKNTDSFMPSSLALGVLGINPYIFSIRSRFRLAPSLLRIILGVCVRECYIK